MACEALAGHALTVRRRPEVTTMEAEARALRITASVRHLANRWVDADKQLLRQVFPLLARGQPVGIDQIRKRTGATASVVEEALMRGRAGRDP